MGERRCVSVWACARDGECEDGEGALGQLRNFAILAHIDHGKSTLADRLLEVTRASVGQSEQRGTGGDAPSLDTLKVEQERGITVKANTATMDYECGKTGARHRLNLIDTPGHVDFAYEVQRSLSACQGALLLVDASQGVQAQTLSNFYAAFERDIVVIPVINKIDLPTADIERATEEIVETFDMDPDDIVCVSAKTGEGVDDVLEAIVARVPPPTGNPDDVPSRMLMFDSRFDTYRGAVGIVAVTDGTVASGQLLRSHATGETYTVKEVGVLRPWEEPRDTLGAGQVGYVTASIKDVHEARVGDTWMTAPAGTDPAVFDAAAPVSGLPTSADQRPVVFSGIYPVSSDEFDALAAAISRLTLNDASVHIAREQSAALGAGFRCGFLGLLHLDVFQQRLEDEYGAEVIVTAPGVPYEVQTREGTTVVESPADFPDKDNDVLATHEPMVEATIVGPGEYVGAIMDLCQKRRGRQERVSWYSAGKMVVLEYVLPLSEIAVDFYDTLKSVTAGYASFDYQERGYEPAPVSRLDVLLNGEPVDALALLVHAERAREVGVALVDRLSEALSRQMFEIKIQAKYKGRIVARSTIKAYRKSVTDKLYGGDRTRKDKLLKKQKRGKKRMRSLGSVSVSAQDLCGVMRRP